MEASLVTDVIVSIFLLAVPIFLVLMAVYIAIQIVGNMSCKFVMVSAFLLLVSLIIAAVGSGAYDPNLKYVDIRNAPPQESVAHYVSAIFAKYCAMARGIETLTLGTNNIARSFGC